MIKNKTKITLNSLTEDQVTTITSLSGVQEFPMRVKCATYGLAYFIICSRKKMSELKEKIVLEIKKIYDPEIPVNIYELGLIYKIEIKEDKKVTLT